MDGSCGGAERLAPTAEDTDTDLAGGGSDTPPPRGGERGLTSSSAPSRTEEETDEAHNEAGGVWGSKSPSPTAS